jgi:hypothetical protein
VARFISAGLPTYTLTFTGAPVYARDAEGRIVRDDYGNPVVTQAGSSFSIKAHLNMTPRRDVERFGLDTSKQNVTILCAEPKESDPRIRHESVCTVSPDWRGLKGTLTIQAGPESAFKAVTQNVGVVHHAIFNEGL